MSDTGHDIRLVGVVGAGTMGSGIAQIAAQAGFDVMLTDRRDEDLERGLAAIRSSLERLLQKEKISASARNASLGRISVSTDLTALSGADLVIEAIFEDVAEKEKLFRELDAITQRDGVLASNTSSISITQLAATVTNPSRFLGLHFFNPVPMLPLVEVIAAEQTSQQTLERAITFAHAIGKTPVVVRDSPGFAVNRILIPMINEAIFALSEGVAQRDDIDSVMTLGAGHPMGPLALADLIGLDVCLSIMELLHRDMGEDKYRPAPLLRRMVAAGKLGRKSGEGFYVYDR